MEEHTDMENQNIYDEQTRIQAEETAKAQVMFSEILTSMFLGENLKNDQKEWLNANYQVIENFLNSPLNDPEDIKLKKLYAKIILLAKQRGILPNELNSVFTEAPLNETVEEREERIEESAEAISATVDEGLEEVKSDYKVGNEEFTPEEKINYMIDRTAAKVSKFADKFVDKGVDWAINAGAAFVTKVCPQALPVVIAAKKVIIAAKPIIKQKIKQGVESVARYVKKIVPVVKKTIPIVLQTVKTMGRKMWSWGKALLGV